MKTLILAASACALLAPTVTPAQLVVGAQGAAVLPRGDVEDGLPMDGELARAVPLELRLGWRVAPATVVGLQGGYAFGSEGKLRQDGCEATGAECKAHLWRMAVRAEREFAGEKWLPFAAAAVGWEWLVERWETSADNWDQSAWSGPFAALEAGVETALARHLRGGALLTAGLGQYRARSEKGETAGYAHADSTSVGSPTIHFWIGVGIRVTFDPWGGPAAASPPPPAP